MAWIELHDTLREHAKTERLAQELNINQAWAVGILCCLWTWAIHNRPDGDLGPVSSSAIARACFWKKKGVDLPKALIQAGWLEEDKKIHKWHEYAGRLIERRAQNALRMRRARSQGTGEEESPLPAPAEGAECAPHVQRTQIFFDSGCAPHVQNTCAARAPSTVPNRTQPNPTVPNQTQPDQTQPGPEKPNGNTQYWDDAWKHSTRARGALAQRITDTWIRQGCTGDKLYDVALSYLDTGLSPDKMRQMRGMTQQQIATALFGLAHKDKQKNPHTEE